MDELSGLLEGPLAQPPTLFRSAFAPPWSLRVDDGATLGLVAVAQGQAWLTGPDGHATLLRAGDVALVRGGEGYTVGDDPATPPGYVIWPGERWSSVEEPSDLSSLVLRPWGLEPEGATVLLVGAFDIDGEITRRLREALPAQLLVPARDLDSHLVTLLDEEASQDDPGQVAMVKRLLDALLITTLRAWFRRPEADVPVWYEAYEDPMVAATLRLLHAHPTRPWTIDDMAAEVGGTRTTLARRFTDMTGETPMAYLARWRLSLAADLFWATNFGLAEVCERVGYSTVYSLSTAFKRVHGINPSQHRKRGRARAAAKAEAAGRIPLSVPEVDLEEEERMAEEEEKLAEEIAAAGGRKAPGDA